MEGLTGSNPQGECRPAQNMVQGIKWICLMLPDMSEQKESEAGKLKNHIILMLCSFSGSKMHSMKQFWMDVNKYTQKLTCLGNTDLNRLF